MKNMRIHIIIHIHVNKSKTIIFKIDIRYFLELLMPETIKLLGNVIIKIARDKCHENIPDLEIRK